MTKCGFFSKPINQFLFMYPIEEYINEIVGHKAYHSLKRSRATRYSEFKDELPKEEERIGKKYERLVNRCIDERYRSQGFQVTFLLFDNHPMSPLVTPQPVDKIIECGLTFKEHTTPYEDGTITSLPDISDTGLEKQHPYPCPNFIIDQLGNIKHLRVGGFHVRDCVQRIARRAYERKIDVVVDEDLTDKFLERIDHKEFQVGVYPTYNPEREGIRRELYAYSRCQYPWLVNA